MATTTTATTSRFMVTAPPTKSPTPSSLSSNMKLVEIIRSKYGYGFTLSGEMPCRLTHVKGHARSGGLCSGDRLHAVNGQNVDSLTHDQVVELITSVPGGRLLLRVSGAPANYRSSSSSSSYNSDHENDDDDPKPEDSKQQIEHSTTELSSSDSSESVSSSSSTSPFPLQKSSHHPHRSHHNHHTRPRHHHRHYRALSGQYLYKKQQQRRNTTTSNQVLSPSQTYDLAPPVRNKHYSKTRPTNQQYNSDGDLNNLAEHFEGLWKRAGCTGNSNSDNYQSKSQTQLDHIGGIGLPSKFYASMPQFHHKSIDNLLVDSGKEITSSRRRPSLDDDNKELEELMLLHQPYRHKNRFNNQQHRFLMQSLVIEQKQQQEDEWTGYPPKIQTSKDQCHLIEVQADVHHHFKSTKQRPHHHTKDSRKLSNDVGVSSTANNEETLANNQRKKNNKKKTNSTTSGISSISPSCSSSSVPSGGDSPSSTTERNVGSNSGLHSAINHKFPNGTTLLKPQTNLQTNHHSPQIDHHSQAIFRSVVYCVRITRCHLEDCHSILSILEQQQQYVVEQTESFPLLIAIYPCELYLCGLPINCRVRAEQIVQCQLFPTLPNTSNDCQRKSHFALMICDDDRQNDQDQESCAIWIRCFILKVDNHLSQSHRNHRNISELLTIQCTPDPITIDHCLEFPETCEPILRILYTLYRRHLQNDHQSINNSIAKHKIANLSMSNPLGGRFRNSNLTKNNKNETTTTSGGLIMDPVESDHMPGAIHTRLSSSSMSFGDATTSCDSFSSYQQFRQQQQIQQSKRAIGGHVQGSNNNERQRRPAPPPPPPPPLPAQPPPFPSCSSKITEYSERSIPQSVNVCTTTTTTVEQSNTTVNGNQDYETTLANECRLTKKQENNNLNISTFENENQLKQIILDDVQSTTNNQTFEYCNSTTPTPINTGLLDCTSTTNSDSVHLKKKTETQTTATTTTTDANLNEHECLVFSTTLLNGGREINVAPEISPANNEQLLQNSNQSNQQNLLLFHTNGEMLNLVQQPEQQKSSIKTPNPVFSSIHYQQNSFKPKPAPRLTHLKQQQQLQHSPSVDGSNGNLSSISGQPSPLIVQQAPFESYYHQLDVNNVRQAAERYHLQLQRRQQQRYSYHQPSSTSENYHQSLLKLSSSTFETSSTQQKNMVDNGDKHLTTTTATSSDDKCASDGDLLNIIADGQQQSASISDKMSILTLQQSEQQQQQPPPPTAPPLSSQEDEISNDPQQNRDSNNKIIEKQDENKMTTIKQTPIRRPPPIAVGKESFPLFSTTTTAVIGDMEYCWMDSPPIGSSSANATRTASVSDVVNTGSSTTAGDLLAIGPHDDDDDEKHDERAVDVGWVGGWSSDFDTLLSDPIGIKAFTDFLRKEFSYENLQFFLAVQDFKNLTDLDVIRVKSKEIYDKFIALSAPDPVNVDSKARKSVEVLLDKPDNRIFALPEKQIYNLMKFDSYIRFLKSDIYEKCSMLDLKGKPLPYELDENFTMDSSDNQNLFDCDSNNSASGSRASSVSGGISQAGSKGNLALNVTAAAAKKRRSFLPWARLKSSINHKAASLSSMPPVSGSGAGSKEFIGSKKQYMMRKITNSITKIRSKSLDEHLTNHVNVNTANVNNKSTNHHQHHGQHSTTLGSEPLSHSSSIDKATSGGFIQHQQQQKSTNLRSSRSSLVPNSSDSIDSNDHNNVFPPSPDGQNKSTDQLINCSNHHHQHKRHQVSQSAGTSPPPAVTSSTANISGSDPNSPTISRSLGTLTGSPNQQSTSSFNHNCNRDNCHFLRIVFPDRSQTVVPSSPNETIENLLQRLIEKRSLKYLAWDVFITGNEKPLDPLTNTVQLGCRELRVEQRVLFQIEFPSQDIIGVKARPTKLCSEVFRPLLLRYGYRPEHTVMTIGETDQIVPVMQPVSVIDGQRIVVAYRDDLEEWGWDTTRNNIPVALSLAGKSLSEDSQANMIKRKRDFLERENNNKSPLATMLSDQTQSASVPTVATYHNIGTIRDQLLLQTMNKRIPLPTTDADSPQRQQSIDPDTTCSSTTPGDDTQSDMFFRELIKTAHTVPSPIRNPSTTTTTSAAYGIISGSQPDTPVSPQHQPNNTTSNRTGSSYRQTSHHSHHPLRDLQNHRHFKSYQPSPLAYEPLVVGTPTSQFGRSNSNSGKNPTSIGQTQEIPSKQQLSMLDSTATSSSPSIPSTIGSSTIQSISTQPPPQTQEMAPEKPPLRRMRSDPSPPPLPPKNSSNGNGQNCSALQSTTTTNHHQTPTSSAMCPPRPPPRASILNQQQSQNSAPNSKSNDASYV